MLHLLHGLSFELQPLPSDVRCRNVRILLITIFSFRLCASLQDLKDYMRQAGEVTYADAHKQRRNEGYV